MKSPIFLAITIAISTSVGFILGTYFEDKHGKDIVLRTVERQNNFSKLTYWFDTVSRESHYLDSISSISNIEELTKLQIDTKNNLQTDITILRNQLSDIDHTHGKSQLSSIFNELIKKIEEKHNIPQSNI